jgi:4-aminobutyrate aminotransferase/(S)-3-amino-2-methylpropionate transaminase
VETAIKMARAYTGRPAIVTYEGAYHGRTLLTLSLTSKYALFKKSFGPFAPEIYRVPYPYAYRCPHCRNEGVCNLTCFEDLERALLTQMDPAAVAALIIEPVQGEGGFIPASYEYLRKVRAAVRQARHRADCRRGAGRLLPHRALVLLRAQRRRAGSGGHGEVHGRRDAAGRGHRQGGDRRCAAPGRSGFDLWRQPGGVCGGAQVIELMERDNLNQRAEQIGEITMAHFRRWQAKYPIIGDVRGLGAMTAIEFVKPARRPHAQHRRPAQDRGEAYQRGLLLIRAGLYSNCVRTLVPLVITDAQLEEGLGVLEAAIAEVA